MCELLRDNGAGRANRLVDDGSRGAVDRDMMLAKSFCVYERYWVRIYPDEG